MHCAILASLPRGYPEAHGRGYPVAVYKNPQTKPKSTLTTLTQSTIFILLY